MNPTYLFIHPLLGAVTVGLILYTYSLKASSRKRQAPHYWAGLSALGMMLVAVGFAAYALGRRQEELGDFPELLFTFTPHYTIAILLLVALTTQATLGLSMRMRLDLIPNIRTWHWRISQVILALAALLALMGVPTFFALLASRPLLQGLLAVSALVFFAGGIWLFLALDRSSLRGPRFLRKRARRLPADQVANVTYLPDSRTVQGERGQSLLQASLQNGIPHTHVCGGNARCSTCRVAVLQGQDNLEPRNRLEQVLADRLDFPPFIRLACQARLKGGAVEVRRLVLDLDDVALASQLQRRGLPTAVGQERELAILFSDIRGFTSFAERLLPYDVVHALNRYYSRVGEAIYRHGGEINNYMGDGFLALFGLSGTPGSPAADAVEAGLEMLQALEELKPYFEKTYGAGIDIGIGVHMGPAVVGEMGARDPKRISVVGDAVNFASRIEEANKTTGTRFLISQDVYERVKDRVQIGRRFPFSPKGKTGDYSIYEVLDVKK
ncbi:MAG: adenylate/guanylate cyclase domain-containing protein [Chloroflexi bacterium]|nr:adenylate/guanylate cyclase domain-containing protein [Chloroflexota bacterium]